MIRDRILDEMTIVDELIDLVGEIDQISDYRDSYRRQLRSLSRRIKLLAPLFQELKESNDPISSRGVETLVRLKSSIGSAKSLLEFGSRGSKIFLALEWDKVMKWFDEVTAQTEQALAGISDNFDISNEVRELVVLVYAQFKRGKDIVDMPDADLYSDIFSIYNNGNSTDANADPSILGRVADKLQLTTISDLTQELFALHDIVVATDCGALKEMFMLLKKIENFVQNQNPKLKNTATSKAPLPDGKQKVSVIPEGFLCPVSAEMMNDAVIIATGQEPSILGADHSTEHFCHPIHKLKLEHEATPYICDGCGELGFNSWYKYNCHCDEPLSSCKFRLHKACAFPEPTITSLFFPDHVFVFLVSGKPGQCCFACGRDIKGYVYHCYDNGLDLHPVCATLRHTIDKDNHKLVVHRKESSRSSKCYKCGKKLRNKRKRWSYVSACESHLCVACVQDMLLDNLEKECLGDRDYEDKNFFMELDEYNTFLGVRDGEKREVKVNEARALVKREMRKLQLVLPKGRRSKCGKFAEYIVKTALTYIVAVVVGDPTAVIVGLISSIVAED